LKAADKKTKEKALRLTSGAKCIGVAVSRIRLLAKAFKQKHSSFTIEEICAVMDNLCKDKCREKMLFGIFLIAGYKKNVL
jgi:hypothetical protein